MAPRIKKPKDPNDNALFRAIRWLMAAEPGMPRSIGIRYEEESATMTIKLFQGLRVGEEVVIEGVRDTKKLLKEFTELQDMIPADGSKDKS